MQSQVFQTVRRKDAGIAPAKDYLHGNQSVVANENAKKLFEGYADILKIVLPPKLGFEGISVIVPEVMLCTKTGNFPIDAVSGGISSIIDITWQLYMFADTSESFVAIIDFGTVHHQKISMEDIYLKYQEGTI